MREIVAQPVYHSYLVSELIWVLFFTVDGLGGVRDHRCFDALALDALLALVGTQVLCG